MLVAAADVPELLTIREAAELLRVSHQTVYQLVRSGRLPAHRVGRQWRISQETLVGWLRESEAPVAPQSRATLAEFVKRPSR